MKKYIVITVTFLLTMALLAGCSEPQVDTNPSGSATEPVTEPTTEPKTEPATEPTPTETKEDLEYGDDASSYYIDVVYSKQIEWYHTAISQQWDENADLDHEMSLLAAYYYEGNPLDNVGFTFMDLDGDGIWELIIGAVQNAKQDPLVFELWTLKNDEPC